jgi:uncharacterized membrane protein (UPF0127 family)
VTPFKEALNKSFDRLRTNGKQLISFVVSLSNALLSVVEGHIANQPVQGFHWLHRLAQLALLLALSSLATAADPRVQILAGAHVLQVEVADTPQLRQTGLMGRTRLESDAGMLFVFEQKATHCFWMKNTLIPLSIAFLADDGTIVDIQDMQPQTLTFHCPRGPIRYALEVPQGGFRSKGIQLGMRVSGGPFGTPP